MSVLVRKVNRSKWPDEFDDIGVQDLPADVMSACLKTSKNTLSTWEIKSLNNEDLEEGILAIAASLPNIDSIDIVTIQKDLVVQSGFQLDENTPGNTAVLDLAETHIDIIELTYKTVGEFSKIVLDALKEEKVTRITRGKLKKILKKALDEGRIDINQLSQSVLSKL
jgi:Zn-dependent M16 (insulinase) family peptidase